MIMIESAQCERPMSALLTTNNFVIMIPGKPNKVLYACLTHVQKPAIVFQEQQHTCSN